TPCRRPNPCRSRRPRRTSWRLAPSKTLSRLLLWMLCRVTTRGSTGTLTCCMSRRFLGFVTRKTKPFQPRRHHSCHSASRVECRGSIPSLVSNSDSCGPSLEPPATSNYTFLRQNHGRRAEARRFGPNRIVHLRGLVRREPRGGHSTKLNERLVGPRL